MPSLELIPVSAVFLITSVFMLGGFVKGVIGLGLPTIVMGMLSLSMPPAEAAALLVVPSLLTNIFQISSRPGLLRLSRRLLTMLLTLCLGIAAGSGWITQSTSPWTSLGLGLSLLAYAGVGLRSVSWQLTAAQGRHWAGPIGFCTGLITAATGVFVIPAVPYLQALGMDKEELVQALGLSFLVATMALGLSLFHAGALPKGMLLQSLAALLPAWLGMKWGQRLRQQLQPATFKQVFLWGLLLLGMYLCLRSLSK